MKRYETRSSRDIRHQDPWCTQKRAFKRQHHPGTQSHWDPQIWASLDALCAFSILNHVNTLPTVSVRSGGRNKIPWAGGLNNRSVFLTVLEARSSSEIRVPARLGSGEASLPSCPLTLSSHGPSSVCVHTERGRDFCCLCLCGH